ncbi:MAG: DMT family transporter [Clostridia bacterium]|nr:DMT family transporter [Clostridia bacterium]
MDKNSIKKSMYLFLTAIVWGITFVAQSEGMKHIETFTFSAIRFFIGGLVLLPFICIPIKNTHKEQQNTNTEKQSSNLEDKKTLLIAGLICGFALFIACNIQQVGIKYTTVGKAGFISAMYIIICPILCLFLKKKPPFTIWIGVIVSMIGLYLLCVTDSISSINKGDIITLISSLFFAIHIMLVDYFSPKCDGVKLSCLQFFTCSVLSFITMLIFEKPEFNYILEAWLPIIYAGIFSSGIGYTLQTIGQKNFNPVIASLILSLESVVSVLAGWIILGQTLSLQEFFGCLLVFSAIILVQVPTPKLKVKNKK